MEKARWVPVLLAAVCAVTPVAGFLPELLLQPLQEVKHAFQPQPQYYQYYRRTVHDQPQQGGYPGYAASGYNGYANPRPVVYQWSRPTSYDVGSGYSYSSNPLTSFLQSSWMPWSNRPSGLGQQYGLFSQPALQQQQPQQQPLQALWATLPWGGSSGQQTTGSVLSLLPWSRPSGSAVHYVPPLVPTATSTIHVMAPQSAAVSPSEATLTAGVKPVDSVAMEPLVQETTAELADNAIRRLAMQAVRQDETPCA